MNEQTLNMLAYFLGKAGQGLSNKGSFGDVVGGAASGMAEAKQMQQFLGNIKGNTSNDLLKTLMAMSLMGGGDLKLGDGGLNFKMKNVPKDWFSQLQDPGDQPFASPNVSPYDYGYRPVNPFASSQPESNAAVLAGFTPETVSAAMQLAQRQQGIEQESIKDIMNIFYKGQELENSRLSQISEIIEKTRKAPIELEGVGEMTLEEWKALPDKVKGYSYYTFDAKRRGEKVMSYSDWERQVDEPTAYQYYKLAMEDPKFEKWYFRSLEAGRPTVNVGERTMEIGRAKHTLEALDPNLYNEAVKRAEKVHISADKISKKAAERGVDYSVAKESMRRDVILRDMNNIVLSAYPRARFIKGKGWVNEDGSLIQRDPFIGQ